MMDEPDAVRSAGLAPVIRDNIRLLVLGSLPGAKSLAARQYYAHPQNQFWRLMANMLGVAVVPPDYGQRLAMLTDRGIGMWDVVASARRSGSLDANMRAPVINDLDARLAALPCLRAVAFNGKTASRLGRRLLSTSDQKIALIDLPSSSAANTQPFVAKAAVWSGLASWLGPQTGNDQAVCRDRPDVPPFI